MKLSTFLSVLPLLASGVVAAPPHTTDLEPTTGRTYKGKPAIRKRFAILDTPKKKRVVVLPAGKAGSDVGGMGGMGGMSGMGATGGAQSDSMLAIMGSDLCGSCTVLEGQIKLVDGAGNPVKNVYVHHILTNGPTTQFPVRALFTGGFVGAGDDNGNSPFRYFSAGAPESETTGYHIQPESSFPTQVVLVNHNPTPQEVYVTYELEYFPDNVGKGIQSALMSAAVLVNKNGKSKSGTLSVKYAGTLVYAKGHLHAGGTAMRLWAYNSTSNHAKDSPYYTCNSVATYAGTPPAIVSMSDCPTGKFKANDLLVMQSEYDTKAHPDGASSGNMGMFRMIYA